MGAAVERGHALSISFLDVCHIAVRYRVHHLKKSENFSGAPDDNAGGSLFSHIKKKRGFKKKKKFTHLNPIWPIAVGLR